MKTVTFTQTITLNDAEHEMLKKISERRLYNFDGPEGQLKLCDTLVGYGLCREDSNGCVEITSKGNHFLYSK